MSAGALTLPALFLARVQRSPDGVAMHARVGQAWGTITWREAERQVAAAFEHLVAEGVGPGDRVAILGNPHPAWLNADLATLAAGAITVGIYPTLLPESVHYILQHAEARVLLVESEAELARLGAVNGRVAGVPARVWDAPTSRDGNVEGLRRAVAGVSPDQICTLIYTSGTTGDPKGAVITHAAMVAVCHASRLALPLEGQHRSIVYLPLAHSLQRMAAYRSFMDEIEAWWCADLAELPAVIALARPTVLVAVPRVLEKMQARIEGTVAGQPATVQRLFAWALAVARRRQDRGCAPVGLRARVEERLAERLVLARVRQRLGGLQFIGVGGAALNVETARFFQAIGVEVLEAWGLTETCAPATLNRPGKVRLGTVGTPLDGVELRLKPDGEVLVRGPGLYSGYWRDPVATAAAMEDGWFCTGDLGELDADGFLRIVDRKKELLVTAGGKNIAPVPIERKLERLPGGAPGIGQAVVIGSERPFLVALLAPDPDCPLDDGEAFAATRVQAVNAGLAPFERIKRWAWIPPLTVENGLLTPTLKPKRRAVLAAHADVIARLYGEPGHG